MLKTYDFIVVLKHCKSNYFLLVFLSKTLKTINYLKITSLTAETIQLYCCFKTL